MSDQVQIYLILLETALNLNEWGFQLYYLRPCADHRPDPIQARLGAFASQSLYTQKIVEPAILDRDERKRGKTTWQSRPSRSSVSNQPPTARKQSSRNGPHAFCHVKKFGNDDLQIKGKQTNKNTCIHACHSGILWHVIPVMQCVWSGFESGEISVHPIIVSSMDDVWQKIDLHHISCMHAWYVYVHGHRDWE